MIGSIVKTTITILFLLVVITANAAADDFPTLLKKLNNIQKQLNNTTQSQNITESQTQIPTNQPINKALVTNNNSNQQLLFDNNSSPLSTLPLSGDELIAELQELSHQLRLMVSQPEQKPEPAVKPVDHQTDDADKFIARLQELARRLQTVVDESKNE